MSVIWSLCQLRELGHVIRYEHTMQDIETALNLDPDMAVSAEINRKSHDESSYLKIKPASIRMMPCTSILMFCTWAAFLIIHFVN